MPKQTPDRIKIHIARKDLLLDDQTYRDILRENFNGAESSTDLSASQVKQLIQLFQARGWKPKSRSRRSPAADRSRASDPMSRKCRALWITMNQAGIVKNGSEKALAAYVKRVTGVDDLRWCTPAQRGAVIEGLKAWQARGK